jgi:hypothetical protein
MNLVLVAGDFLESTGLRAIQVALQEQGHLVTAFLADGQPPRFTDFELRTAVQRADFVLLTISNNIRETLLAASTAETSSIPFGIYAGGGPKGFQAENLAPLRTSARLVFVFNHDEVAKAQDLFPNAEVVASGSMHWEKFFSPDLTRKEARLALKIGEDQFVILVPGDKDPILNILLFGLTIEAASLLSLQLKRLVTVVIGLHPGDRHPPSLYADLARFAPLNVSVTFICRSTPNEMPVGVKFLILPTPHCLPGIDILVNFTSSLGYEAACQRRPVICFLPQYAQGLTVGKRWEQCENGTAVEVLGSSPERLAETIVEITKNSIPLTQKQATAYPTPPKTGAAVRTVIRHLENFSRRS